MDSRPTTQPSADFDPASDFKARRASRVAMDESARLSPSATYQIAVNVRNLSPCGFMAECEEAVGIGSFVTLDIPGLGRVDAQVRWQVGSRMGGMFTDPISLGRCEWVGERADKPKSD
jgi:hypothetical protein